MKCPLCLNPKYSGPLDPELEREHYEVHIKEKQSYESMMDTVLNTLFTQFDEVVKSSELTKTDIEKLTNLAREIRNYVKQKFEVNQDLERKLSITERQYERLRHIIFSTLCNDCFNAVMQKLDEE